MLQHGAAELARFLDKTSKDCVNLRIVIHRIIAIKSEHFNAIGQTQQA
jgi:hypothetical protein